MYFELYSYNNASFFLWKIKYDIAFDVHVEHSIVQLITWTFVISLHH